VANIVLSILRRMGNLLESPKTEKYTKDGSGNGLCFSVSSMQGWRIAMEDAHSAIAGLGPGLEEWSFFGVFDGHAGASVSKMCSEQLLDCILESKEFQQSNVAKGIRSGFLSLDTKLREVPELASGEDKSGSTAVCALISPTNLYIANCGDSRAVISRSGKVSFSTVDHKPVVPAERERILKAGGTVETERVNGFLAVSRALGDYDYKNVKGVGPCEQLVSPEPEIYVEERDMAKDEFLILACDGVWDVMSNEDVCSYVRYLLSTTSDLVSITNSVIDTCLHKRSADNMSIVLVTFPGAPKPDPQVIAKDEKLNNVIKQHFLEFKESRSEHSIDDLMLFLEGKDLDDIPPGGGLDAKRNYVEDLFNQHFKTSS